ncbi:MAG: dihydrodipicolinate synthase family protein [Caldilineaceae bacterium]
MSYTIELPLTAGQLTQYTLSEPQHIRASSTPFTSRVAFAAAHVVADPNADHTDRSKPAQLDWGATLAYRRHLWSLGFAVAEAMDTAQRGMGLDWTASQELIRRSLAEARAVGGVVACGAGTDHLTPSPARTVDEVIAAYEEQIGYVEGLGGRVIMMASRALAACAQSPADYACVYNRILSQVKQPVIIHWLGDMFDPQLAGYWGSHDLGAAMETCLAILHENASKIDGIKISLLDAQREIVMRRRLPANVKMYTGDDFNYPELILGDEQGYSHALLGIFDAIAPVAAAAFHALDAGDTQRYCTLLEPTVALSRHIFQTPTYNYKTGIVFLAWLNNHQAQFKMVAAQESARSVQHLANLFVLADKAGLLCDPELAVKRMQQYLDGMTA